jgi:hypothetical protein
MAGDHSMSHHEAEAEPEADDEDKPPAVDLSGLTYVACFNALIATTERAVENCRTRAKTWEYFCVVLDR